MEWRVVYRRIDEPLKSDQNGIEIRLLSFSISFSFFSLKSDQNGIEIVESLYISHHVKILKSDQNGIEICYISLRHFGRRHILKSDQNGIEIRVDYPLFFSG